MDIIFLSEMMSNVIILYSYELQYKQFFNRSYRLIRVM